MSNENNQTENNPFKEQNINENQQDESKENQQDESKETQEVSQEEIIDQIVEEQVNGNKELEDLKNQYLRLAADFDNYRKRQAQERESLLKYGAEDTLKKLLPVLDTFIRAEQSMTDVDDCQKVKENFEVVKKQFFDTLDKIGLKKIETENQEFNPNLHEAVMQTPTSEHPDHSIIQELQSGYKFEDRIIRPSLVNVAVSE